MCRNFAEAHFSRISSPLSHFADFCIFLPHQTLQTLKSLGRCFPS